TWRKAAPTFRWDASAPPRSLPTSSSSSPPSAPLTSPARRSRWTEAWCAACSEPRPMLAIRGAFSRFFAESGFFLAAGLAFFVLLFFSTPLFGALRLVMHRMLGVRADGNYLRNLLLDAVLVILLTVLLFLASVVTAIFQWFQEYFLEAIGVPWAWLYWTAVAFSLSLSTGMFYFGYRYVPRRRPHASTALTGAIVTAVLWEIAKQVFRLYIRRVSVYDQIYGPLGVLIAFVMFVYYTCIVFVFGAAYVASLEARRAARQ